MLYLTSIIVPDPCDDKQFCKNGGSCIQGGFCYCPPKVTGMNCENGMIIHSVLFIVLL